MGELKRKWEEISEGTSGWIVYIVLGVVLALITHAALGALLSTQYPVVTVKSRSMVPTLNVGDMVFVQKTGDYKTGDIIVFKGWKSTPIIHRVVVKGEKNPEGINIEVWEEFDQFPQEEFKEELGSDPSKLYITKGDHNDKCDQCYGKDYVSQKDIYGENILTVPYVGWVKLGFVRLKSLLVGSLL